MSTNKVSFKRWDKCLLSIRLVTFGVWQFGDLVFIYIIPYTRQEAKCHKILKKFEFPLKYDFDALVGGTDRGLKASDVSKKGFSLQAALLHTGASMNSGHYTAYTRSSEGKTWLGTVLCMPFPI